MNESQFPDAFISLVVGLGARRRFFPVKPINRVGSLVIALLLTGGSLLVFVYGLYLAYLAYQQHGLVMIESALAGPLMICLIMLVLAGVAGWAAYANWNKGAALYERGFALRDRKGLQTWRWEDILTMTTAVTRHYTNGIYTGTTHFYTLVDRKGLKLVLGDIYFKVEELAKAIQEAIYPLLYEQAAQQFNAGQTLSFGPVSVSRAGFQVGKKAYPWSEVCQVSIHQGTLKISRNGGGWFNGSSLPASIIPNLNVLLNLIHQTVGLKLDLK